MLEKKNTMNIMLLFNSLEVSYPMQRKYNEKKHAYNYLCLVLEEKTSNAWVPSTYKMNS